MQPKFSSNIEVVSPSDNGWEVWRTLKALLDACPPDVTVRFHSTFDSPPKVRIVGTWEDLPSEVSQESPAESG